MSYLMPPVNPMDHFRGNGRAPIELVEYGDYQCEHCGHAYWILKEVLGIMGQRLKFVYRNFPLSEAHPYAFRAALAAEAAAMQHRFWEMHDMLYEHQTRLGPRHLLLYAEEIGADPEAFIRDIEDEGTAEKVKGDFESGIRSGVNGTPSFFINGSKYEGGWELEELLGYLSSL